MKDWPELLTAIAGPGGHELGHSSLYDERWLVDGENDTRAVAACPAPDASSFRQ